MESVKLSGLRVTGRTTSPGLRRAAFSALGLVLAGSVVLCDVDASGVSVRAADAQAQGTSYELTFRVAPGLDFGKVALGTSGNLFMRDRSRVDAPISNVGVGFSELGVEAVSKDIYTEQNLTLRDRAQVDGQASVGGTLTRGNNTSILGGYSTGLSFANSLSKTLVVAWPSGTPTNIDLQPDQTLTLQPGKAYGSVAVKSRSTLVIPQGKFFIGDLTVEPQAKILFQDTSDLTEFYIKNSFTWRGELKTVDGSSPNWLVGFIGTQRVPVEAPFEGLLIAPNAEVTLARVSTDHVGQFFAKNIELHPDQHVVHKISSIFDGPITPYGDPIYSDLSCSDTNIKVTGPVTQNGVKRYSGLVAATPDPDCPTPNYCTSDALGAPQLTVADVVARVTNQNMPKKACDDFGAKSIANCSFDPATIDKSVTCNDDKDCPDYKNGQLCTEYCVDRACTETARGCGYRTECDGLENDTKGCAATDVYVCTASEDVGTTTADQVTAWVTENGYTSVTTSIPDDEKATVPAYADLSETDTCSTHTLQDGAAGFGEEYKDPPTELPESEDTGTETEFAPALTLGNSKWGLYARPRLYHKASVSHARLDQFELEAKAQGSLVAGARVFGKPITALDMNGGATVNQCRIEAAGKFLLFGQTIDSFGWTPDDDLNGIMDDCENAFEDARVVGASLDRAMILARELRGIYEDPEGDLCTWIRSTFNDFELPCESTPREALLNWAIDRYYREAESYAGKRSEYLAKATQAAEQALPDTTLLKLGEPFSLVGVHQSIPVGPVCIVIDAQVYGEWWVNGGIDFGLDMDETPGAHAGAFFTPGIAVDASVYAGVGWDAGVIGASVGLEGQLRLVEVDVPVKVDMSISRESIPESTFGRDYQDSDWAGEPVAGLPVGQVYRWNGGWNFGAAFGLASMSGRLNAAARVRFLFFSETYRVKLADWTGFEKQYFPIASASGSADVVDDVTGQLDPAAAFPGTLDFGDFAEVYAYTKIERPAGAPATLDSIEDDAEVSCIIIK